MRVYLNLLVLVGALALLSPGASAGVGEGDAAPEFEGKEYVNTAACTLKALRGQAVFLEIFRTT